ncbi:putative reverse transcriptase domain-containing protein [Tanacetum coccineum]|uniref:Reverse transcriptase domain-containing protein n=1 Tax=Tanacetum coccineum TaxID=301880 RepID=A0ABQ5FAM9_9ASTR
MTAPIISILSNSSEESVGSHATRVIIFGTIPTSIPIIPVVPAEVPIAPVDPLVAPKVGAVYVISPTGELDLVDYSSSFDFYPSEDSLPVAPELPLAIPFGRPYRTHPNGSRKLLTARKKVRPFPARRLAWRRVSHLSSDHHSSPDFTSDSSSSSLSLDSSLDISSGSSSESLLDSSSVHSSGQSHSRPSTRVASPRLVDPSIKTQRCSEAFMRWRSKPLSTLYPPTTSESSLDSCSERPLDSSSHSAGPSHKRCISPTTLVPSSTPVSRSIAPALSYLPPHKRFRDSYSSEVSGEEHIEMGTVDAETIADLGINEGVRAHTKDGIDLGVEVATSDIREDEEEFEAKANAGGTMEITVDPLATGDISEPTRGDAPDLEGTLFDMSHYMSEVSLDRITEFETAQRQLEADRVDSLRRHMALSQEEFRQVYRDCDDTQRRLRRLQSLVERRLGFHLAISRIESHRMLCLVSYNNDYHSFWLKAKAKMEVTVIMQMVEMEMVKMEMVEMEIQMRMIEVLEKYQVKYATYTLLNNALTWWETHKRTIGDDAVFAMSWRELIKLMAEMVPEEEDRVEKFIGGHYRNDCPKLKDQNHGNKTGNKNGIGETRGKAYVLGGGDANPDSNVVMCAFLLNNHYAYVLFDSGVDRSFVLTTFSTLLDIIPNTLDVSYAIELADERTSKTNTVLRGYTLGLLGHPFNIDLMPVELGSFDVVIGMDWLAKHHAVIVCDEKIVRIPYGDEVFIVQEVMKKETKDKSEEKQLEDVPTVRDFLKVILEDFPGLPPT